MERNDMDETFFNFVREQATLIIGAIVAGIISAITVYFKRLPSVIRHKTRKAKILFDWTRSNMVNAIIQDLVDDVGCIYGHIINYHNHGPIKMTVLHEVIGHPCAKCMRHCLNKTKIRRLQGEWIERPIQPFWLTRVALKTLSDDGMVNKITYDELNDIHKEIWDAVNIYSHKEILLKTHADGFITLALSFCERFQDVPTVDPKMMAAANRLQKLC
jgi:hypothetical protein